MPEFARDRSVIAVLCGGWSREREVSLVSGACCAEALRGSGYQVEVVDVERNLGAVLLRLAPDVCLNMLHGRWGEDGCVQGVLEFLGVPYSHSGVEASALGMSKEHSKRVFRDAGLPVAKSFLASATEIAAGHLMTPPYVVKPNNEGSSIDVTIVGENDPPPTMTGAGRERWMIEEYVPGAELTTAIMDGRALEVTEIVATGGGFYDYSAKYESGASQHVIPARVAPGIREQVLEIAAEAHRVVGCRGVTRADFRLDPARGPVLLEINTQPGMTPTSLVPEQAAYLGITFPDLVEWMVKDASCPR